MRGPHDSEGGFHGPGVLSNGGQVDVVRCAHIEAAQFVFRTDATDDLLLLGQIGVPNVRYLNLKEQPKFNTKLEPQFRILNSHNITVAIRMHWLQGLHYIRSLTIGESA